MASQFKRAAVGNFALAGFPFVTGFVAVMSLGADATKSSFYFGIATMILGWLILVASKWDQVRKGDIWTFGVSKDRPQMRRYYYLSYLVMFLGWLIACLSGRH
jgi:formate hydrogenlyase subunit 3/multisubunit Na+/H+ antiporter MnhD subunit